MFSKSTEYALRAIIYLAQKSSVDQKIGITELSKAIGSPKSFTAKILQQLTRGGKLVDSVTGPGGGFYLSEKAKSRSLYYVLQLLDEEMIINGCVLGLRDCSDVNPCPMHSQYKLIKPQLVEMFSHKTIRDLAEEMKMPGLTIKGPRR